MSEFLIKNYVSKLTISEIDAFSRTQGLSLNDQELRIIEHYIKNDWRTIIYGNPRPILDELKKSLDSYSYQKIENLYIEFKNKYKNYL